jgi:hypothetical protein
MVSHSSVSITVDDADPREPSSRCDRCGNQGTVARAVRHSEPKEIFRYCITCWPAAQQALAQRQAEEQNEYRQAYRAWVSERSGSPNREPAPPAGWSSSSRSWGDVQRFLGLIAGQMKGGPGATPAQLSQIAGDIKDKAAEMVGRMPRDVKAFLAKHLPPSI